jgi:hypothetical protein
LSNCSYSIKGIVPVLWVNLAIEYIIFKFSNFVVGISILLRSKNKSELIPTMYILSTFEIIDSKASWFQSNIYRFKVGSSFYKLKVETFSLTFPMIIKPLSTWKFLIVYLHLY